MDLYIQVHARRHLPSAVPWISEDRLLAIGIPNTDGVIHELYYLNDNQVITTLDFSRIYNLAREVNSWHFENVILLQILVSLEMM